MLYDVLIVGGGLVGSSFALDLIKQNPNLKIAIIEQQPPDFQRIPEQWDNKIYAISPTNYTHLLALGVKLETKRSGTVDTMCIRGNSGGLLEFNQVDAHKPFLTKIIEYANLQQAIYAQLVDKVEFIFATIATIDNASGQEVHLHTTNEPQTYSCRWLVAADGANSMVRRNCAFKTKDISYEQRGLVANFNCQVSANQVAYQWFLPDGVLAYLPLPEHKISIVWSSSDYQRLLALTPHELCREVAAAGNYQLGELTLLTPPQAFPLRLNLVQQFYQQRVILIGDAAHTIHPLAGQGVNLGFADAWALATMLGATLTLDYADLAKYNYTRLASVRQMQLTCHLLQRLFTNRSRGVDKLRNLGLNLLNQFAPVKKALINSAINY